MSYFIFKIDLFVVNLRQNNVNEIETHCRVELYEVNQCNNGLLLMFFKFDNGIDIAF